jgi:hypothetical protein
MNLYFAVRKVFVTGKYQTKCNALPYGIVGRKFRYFQTRSRISEAKCFKEFETLKMFLTASYRAAGELFHEKNLK